MIDVENSFKRFKALKELAKNNKGYIEPTLYESEIETIIKALEYYQLGDCMNECEHYKNCSDYIYSKGYNKAIDDVMKKAREIQEEQIKNLEQSPMRNGKRWATYMGTYLGHMQVVCKRLIEERLKS